MTEITDIQAEFIINNKEIPDEIVNSSERVAVILTQDWCPQWKFMETFLKKIPEDEVKIYYLSYNNKPYFREFMFVKETTWKNHQVPFILYFNNGQLTDISNYCGHKAFNSYFKQSELVTES